MKRILRTLIDLVAIYVLVTLAGWQVALIAAVWALWSWADGFVGILTVKE